MTNLPRTVTRLTTFTTLCLALSMGACKPETAERDDSKSEAAAETDDEGTADEKDDESNPFAAMAKNPFAAMLGSKLSEPGPYDPPKQSEGYDPKQPHLRVLELSGSIAEVESFDPFAFGSGGGSKQTRQILDELDELADEEQLRGLVLRLGPLSMDMARAEELRAALLAFKTDDRKLYCHAETLSNADYYLLSACDQLTMAPVGGVMITGPAATPIHLKGMLDKLGIQADFLHVGAFKGAAEPLTRDAPSPEMIETLSAIVDSSYATMVAGIAEGRAKSPEVVAGWIDQALFTVEQAQQAGLIDAVSPWEPYLDQVREADSDEALGWKKVAMKHDMFADPMALQRFIGLAPPKRPSEPHVALVYAVGNIIDGKGQGAVGARQEIASAQLVPVLDRLAADDKVAAVVLRVDSGGGSALASEQIWHAVERLRGKKPVVVSMAGVAASGGYYIACGADKIYADPNTLTGSIGVVGGKLVLGDALERVGITSFEVKKGARAMMWSPMQPWTDDERAAVQAMMESTYEVFLSRVAAGRKLERDAVHEIAQGRVWTGADAKQRGLVDELGGLEAAIAAAGELGKVEAAVGLEVYPGEPTLKDLLGSFEQMSSVSTSVRGDGLPPALGMVVDELTLGLGPAQGAWVEAVRRSLRTLFVLRGTTLWTVEWLQPPR